MLLFSKYSIEKSTVQRLAFYDKKLELEHGLMSQTLQISILIKTPHELLTAAPYARKNGQFTLLKWCTNKMPQENPHGEGS